MRDPTPIWSQCQQRGSWRSALPPMTDATEKSPLAISVRTVAPGEAKVQGQNAGRAGAVPLPLRTPLLLEKPGLHDRLSDQVPSRTSKISPGKRDGEAL